jgi:hypothetical protein
MFRSTYLDADRWLAGMVTLPGIWVGEANVLSLVGQPSRLAPASAHSGGVRRDALPTGDLSSLPQLAKGLISRRSVFHLMADDRAYLRGAGGHFDCLERPIGVAEKDDSLSVPERPAEARYN